MKHLKYISLLMTLLLAMNTTAIAQDSRGRVASTIVADGLAQLPAQNLETLNQVMSEIAATGTEGINMLVEYLNATEEGRGATFEYAIDGLTSYVSAGRENLRPAIIQGLRSGISSAKTNARKAFYVQQIGKIASADDVAFLQGLLTDDYLKEYALAALAPLGHGKAAAAPAPVAENAAEIAAFSDKITSAATEKQPKMLLKALKDDNRCIRVNALEMATGLLASQDLTAFASQVAKAYPKLSADAQTDVLRWLGNNHDASQTELITAAISSPDSQLATAAIEAAGRIGGEGLLGALIGALNGPYATAAKAALTTFNGDIKSGILSALQSQGTNISKDVVALAGERRIHEAYQPLTALIGKDGLHYAAVKSLAEVVTPATFDDLLQRFSNYPEPYYSLLAQRGSQEDLQQLVAAAQTGSCTAEATAALLKVNKSDAVAPLMQLASSNTSNRDALLARALVLTQKSNWASLTKYQLYRQALEMKPSKGVANNFITALGGLNNEPALNLAAQYLEVKDNDLAAAHAVADLIQKNEPFQRGAHVRQMLLRAQEVFRSHTEDADAGYAVDQVSTILPKIVDDPNAATALHTQLSAEEKKAGFELLFDGTNLDKWTGNKSDYVPIDGAIYVSAHYGSEGNLYTTRKYSDFVFRFEFCFVRPGINNGVGIRTREGVDAAYEGMEIQILDHDDPIYQGLRPYQQHGSVYGIIVPEHVKFGPLGTWNTEEIRAEGDHITVTVNGKVILDGNIREACQGHNMAPEAGKPNPYTVDHQSHPGLFNPDGLICFCGHGEGLKLRNIRVLDLTKK
ncbi:MAG: DUF1080 domain-containing protein [Bacteroidaceae bacterium]|nr:DUF1080 domain-containing protein [Bacteroidaceae bacterium]